MVKTYIGRSFSPSFLTRNSKFDGSRPCRIPFAVEVMNLLVRMPCSFYCRDSCSLLTLVMRIMRLLLSEGDTNADLDSNFATVLREMIAMSPEQLVRVSGCATQYIGRFLNLLYHWFEFSIAIRAQASVMKASCKCFLTERGKIRGEGVIDKQRDC